ncbi:MAG: alanine racemase, partial [Lachnospiraceae bacterium]|nr:alanine racemase [Lachnospiraceae bacterium]
MEEKEFLNTYSTPMYVFDAGVLKRRVEFLKNSLPENVSLCYAIKANTFIVKELDDIIDRFEVCSPGELSVCRELNISGEKIIFSGVYKTPSVVEGLMEEDYHMGIYSIESMVQYKLLIQMANKYNRHITVMPRLTSGNQFGMTKDEVKTIIKEVMDMPNVSLAGIQFFSGTQKNSLKKLKRELTKLDEFIELLKEELEYVPEELEFGPGFPVTYFEDEEFDEVEFLKGFSEIINEMNFKSKITLELGRSIAASCGNYYTSVVDMKSNKG